MQQRVNCLYAHKYSAIKSQQGHELPAPVLKKPVLVPCKWNIYSLDDEHDEVRMVSDGSEDKKARAASASEWCDLWSAGSSVRDDDSNRNSTRCIPWGTSNDARA